MDRRMTPRDVLLMRAAAGALAGLNVAGGSCSETRQPGGGNLDLSCFFQRFAPGAKPMSCISIAAFLERTWLMG
jgi:hypothetical protein